MSGKSSTKDDTVTVDLEAFNNQQLTREEELGSEPSSIAININRLDNTDFLEIPHAFKVLFFDYKIDAFREGKKLLPKGYTYIFVKTLPELNQNLKSVEFQILVLNYDVASKSMNQISAEVRKKLPSTKVILASRAIAPEKALAHSKTSSGAAGYFQFPLDPARLEVEFNRIHMEYRRV